MQHRFAVATFLMCSLLLAACSGGDGGPKIVLFQDTASVKSPQPVQTASRQATPRQSAPVRDADGGYRVNQGDTLYLIARRFHVPIRNLIEANGLVPPYRLAQGQRLVIPSSQFHTVARGETLYGIARQHAVATTEIVRLNNMGPPYTIRPGQLLYLPARIETAAPARPQVAALTVQPVSRPAAKPVTPAPSRTVSKPASTAKPKAQPQAKVARPAARPAPAVADSVVYPRPPKRPAQTQVAARSVERPKAAKARPPAPKRKAIAAMPARSAGKFLWPVRGRVVSSFGPKGKGLHNDGINIAAPRGTPVKAAENGVVAYSGNELRGFGNLVLIRHADGYMTAYGHTAEVLVERGQTVRRGQTIARVGSSGSVSSPQLHFEIRKKKQALNPRRYLEG